MRTLALTAALATGCSSSYVPQSRGRVSVMMKDGAITYVRDGKLHAHGVFGGGLRDAVSGHPHAERAADEYNDRLKLGFVGLIGGAACVIGSGAYAVRELDADSNDDSAERAMWLMLGCSAAMVLGSLYMASAEPYRWDAINLFNDAPPPSPGFPPGPSMPPGPPSWSSHAVREQTLHMRSPD